MLGTSELRREASYNMMQPFPGLFGANSEILLFKRLCTVKMNSFYLGLSLFEGFVSVLVMVP